MVARDSRTIGRSLRKKGFHEQQGHHRNYQLFVDGENTGISTFISHGSKDYGNSLLASMSRQLHLSKQELLQLIDCQMSGDDYVTLMRERGHIA